MLFQKQHKTITILLTKTTAAQNEVAHSYGIVRGLYFLAVVFVRSISQLDVKHKHYNFCG